jgi:MFS family permease
MSSRDPADKAMRVAAPALTRSAWNSVSSQVLFLLCLMYLIFYVDRVNISTAAPLIKSDLGLSNTALGFAFSAFAYPHALFQLIGGWLGDKFGPRLTLGVSGLVVCVATALTGAVGGLATLVLVRLALGFGEGAAFPTATRAMAAWMPPGQWGFAQGVTHSFSRMGNALTPPLIAWLIALISWRGSFVVLGAASLVWMAVWVWFFRDDPRTHPRMTAAELERLDAGRKPAAARSKVPWLSLARRVLPVTAVDFCYGWTLWLFPSWIPSFFFQNFHLNLKNSALFFRRCLPVWCSRRHPWRCGKRPHSQAHRQFALGPLLGHRRRPFWRLRLLDPGGFAGRPNRDRSVPVIGILLRRAGGGPDLGGTHGHRAPVCRVGQRHNEFRFWHGRDHLALYVRLRNRPDRQLDFALSQVDGTVAHRLRTGAAVAA